VIGRVREVESEEREGKEGESKEGESHHDAGAVCLLSLLSSAIERHPNNYLSCYLSLCVPGNLLGNKEWLRAKIRVGGHEYTETRTFVRVAANKGRS
jgi:hypothetical protein